MLKIHRAKTEEDLETAKRLFVEYAESLEFNLCFQNFKQELADFPGCYAPPSGCILLAEYQGQAVGCVALRDLGDGSCEMKRLYVRPQFRGLKIGRKLAEYVVAEARKIGYSHMLLDFISPRETAEALYRSLGFEETSPYEKIPLEGAVFMKLEIKQKT